MLVVFRRALAALLALTIAAAPVPGQARMIFDYNGTGKLYLPSLFHVAPTSQGGGGSALTALTTSGSASNFDGAVAGRALSTNAASGTHVGYVTSAEGASLSIDSQSIPGLVKFATATNHLVVDNATGAAAGAATAVVRASKAGYADLVQTVNLTVKGAITWPITRSPYLVEMGDSRTRHSAQAVVGTNAITQLISSISGAARALAPRWLFKNYWQAANTFSDADGVQAYYGSTQPRSGGSIQAIQADLLERVIAQQPDIVLLNGGTNNVGAAFSPTDGFDADAALVDALHTGLPYAQIVVTGIGAIDTPRFSSDFTPHHRTLDAMIVGRSNFTAASILLTATPTGGTGCVPGDIVNLSGGTLATGATAAQVKILTVGANGLPTAGRIVKHGIYTALPTTATQASTTGSCVGTTWNTSNTASYPGIRAGRESFVRVADIYTPSANGTTSNSSAPTNNATFYGTAQNYDVGQLAKSDNFFPGIDGVHEGGMGAAFEAPPIRDQIVGLLDPSAPANVHLANVNANQLTDTYAWLTGSTATLNGQATAAVVVNPGATYAVGDTIPLAGGTATTPTSLTVATITGGGSTGPIGTVTVGTPGVYSVLPTDNVQSQASTSGSGSGATFRVTRALVGVMPTSAFTNLSAATNQATTTVTQATNAEGPTGAKVLQFDIQPSTGVTNRNVGVFYGYEQISGLSSALAGQWVEAAAEIQVNDSPGAGNVILSAYPVFTTSGAGATTGTDRVATVTMPLTGLGGGADKKLWALTPPVQFPASNWTNMRLAVSVIVDPTLLTQGQATRITLRRLSFKVVPDPTVVPSLN